MAFQQYRNRRKDSGSHDFDLERFAYDVFAYILPICGFPQAKIPSTLREANIYAEDEVIMNVGLSVLPIAFYMRDNWKSTFESKLEETGFNNILEIEEFLESTLLDCPDYEEEDTLSKIQFSLALYSEMILFFNYKGIETYFDSLPKSWTQFCARLIARSDDINEPLSFFLIMYPDVSEAWIKVFIKKEAIPYGRSEDVSDRFCLYSVENEAANDSTENDPDEDENDPVEDENDPVEDENDPVEDENDPVVQGTAALYKMLQPSLPEDSDSGSYYFPGGLDLLDFGGSFLASEEKPFVETTTHTRHKNGLNYVLNQYQKGKKRSRSLKLEVEDAFSGISLAKENISPENRDTKRRRKISVKYELE